MAPREFSAPNYARKHTAPDTSAPATMSSMASKSKGSKARSGKSKPTSMTKSQFVGELSAKTGMSKSQVNSVLSAVSEVVATEVGAGRPIALPGLVKITSVRKPATHARPGINPFTKEAITIKAKPARSVVKVRALKALKDMI